MNAFTKSYAMGHSQKVMKSLDRIQGPVKVFQKSEEDSFESKNSSITSECRANHSINDSISFKNIFFSEGRPHGDKIFGKSSQRSCKIGRLKEKVMTLTEDLARSSYEIRKLKEKLEETSKKHAIQLQGMQEKHEIKLKKTKKDIDFLLNDLNSKSTAIVAQTFMQKHSEEMEAVHKHYENLINILKSEHERKSKFQKNEKSRFLRVLKLKLEKLSRNKFPVSEIFDLMQDFEGSNKENDSFEEMSTVESECVEKKSLQKLKKHSSLF
jgi:hypothetical protein